MSDKEKEEKEEKPQFGEWQRCPCCDVNGQEWVPQTIGGYPSIALTLQRTCTTCGGAKIIQRPIISKTPHP